MCQCTYVANILDEFQMNDYNLVAIARSKNVKFGKDEQGEDVNLTLCDQIINKLICITNSHFDLMYGIVRIFNRYMNMPKKTHLVKGHHILKYFKGTQDYDILINSGMEMNLKGLPMQIRLVIMMKGSLLGDKILAHSLANVEMTSVQKMKLFTWM